MSAYQRIKEELYKLANHATAQQSQKFFKTARGEYAENDQFLGIRVPLIRAKVKKHHPQLNIEEVLLFLTSSIHEERLFALLVLVEKFKKEEYREHIYEIYLSHTKFINNWDLVDSSAHLIVGAYLADKNKDPLYSLAQSTSLWEKRIAIIATLFYIRKNDFQHTLKIADILLHDQHDLIHKAVGWMLREVGKRDKNIETCFLDKYAATMPRTMLRYAIEKFSADERLHYLQIK